MTLFKTNPAALGHLGISVNGGASRESYGQNAPQYLTRAPGTIQIDKGQIDQRLTISVTVAQATSISKYLSAQNGSSYTFLDRNCAGVCSLALSYAGLEKVIGPNSLFVIFGELQAEQKAGNLNPQCVKGSQ